MEKRINTKLFIVLFTLFIIGQNLIDEAYCQSFSSGIIYAKKTLLITGEVLIATYISMITHELGHGLWTKLLGAEEVKFKLYPHRSRSGHLYLGWTSWRGNFSKFENGVISAGGVTTTRIVSEGIDCLLNRTTLPDFLIRPLSMYYLICRLDMPRYILFDFIRQITNKHRPGDDIHSIITKLSLKKDEQNKIYILFILGSVIDIFLDRNEIKDNINRITGKNINHKSGKRTDVNFFLDFETKKIALELSLKM
ncbi:hypothetical protein DRQ09_09050 [candidate division KSB1 bacterium]|nr:MAG: hypothetical protein DRQ09_09050 [candidate division KSB1 bacterium]